LDLGRHFLDRHPVLDLLHPKLLALFYGAAESKCATLPAHGVAEVEMPEAFNEIVIHLVGI
jgi:hypothetical protein